MSYSSELDERRRRKRRQDARLVIYALRSVVATAALVAIAFAFDLPEKIRARLWGPPPRVATQEPRVGRTSPRPPIQTQEQEAERPALETKVLDPFDDPPRRQSATESGFALENNPVAPAGKDEVVIPGRPGKTVLGPGDDSPVAPKVDEEEPIGQLVELKLDKRQLRIPLADVTDKGDPKLRVRVIALREIEAKVELQPTDGMVDDEQLQILFPDCPRARILIRVDKIGQRIFLVVEPQMALWADQPMPYTLKKIKSEAHKTRQAADEFFIQLAAAEEEKAALEAWIKPGTGIKALADVQRANKRIAVLNALIEKMSSQIDEVKQGVEQVDALERLADLLDGEAKLQFETIDAD